MEIENPVQDYLNFQMVIQSIGALVRAHRGHSERGGKDEPLSRLLLFSAVLLKNFFYPKKNLQSRSLF